ncbi:MAG: hypothetical protein QMC13_05360, partial [Colwellia sp.]
MTELDNTLLQDMENQDLENNTPQEIKTMGFAWPIGLSVFILVFSFYLYSQIGTYEKLTTMTAQAPIQQPENPEQQTINDIKRLMDMTKTEPENSDAWYRLGQTLVTVGEFEGAL